MSELYNKIEDSFLGKHVHEGAMHIRYSNGITQMRQHPLYGDYRQMSDYTQEQYLELLYNIDPLFNWEGQYISKEVEESDMTIIAENDGFTGIVIDIVTAHNVYEIEAKRLSSNDEDELNRAMRYSEAVKTKAPKW